MKHQFEELFKRCGASKEVTESTWKFLVTHYTMPNRHYHNFLHIAKCLDAFNEYIENVEKPRSDPLSNAEQDIIQLAIWFHDLIYLPEKSNNEEVSASIAKRTLAEHTTLSEEQIAQVGKCILATTHQKLAKTDSERIIADIDLISLAANPNEFYANNFNISREYSYVPYGAFIEGNTAFLKTLVEGRPVIYQTKYFSELYESNARKNIMNRIEQQTRRDLNGKGGKLID